MDEVKLKEAIQEGGKEVIKEFGTKIEQNNDNLKKEIKADVEKIIKDSDFAKAADLNQLVSDFKKGQQVISATKEKSLVDLLKENEANIKALQDGSVKSFNLNYNTKAVGTMTRASVTAIGSAPAYSLNQHEAGFTRIPRSAPFISQLFPSYPINTQNASYTELKNPEGSAAMTAEGALKSQADFELVEATSKVKKVTAYIKVSKESLADIEGLAGEINQELLTLVELKADSQILSGSGSGENLTGVLTSATTFAAGSFAVLVPTPNEYDVLKVAINQIKIAEVVSGEPAGFMPDTIILHPTDVGKMLLFSKETTGGYIFGSDYQSYFQGITVIENPRMTAGSFLVFDSTKATIRPREATNLNIGYENDDFTKNLVTVLAEKRLAFYIKSNHARAFVTGVFSTAKTAITKP